jgi:hypothetical protein
VERRRRPAVAVHAEALQRRREQEDREHGGDGDHGGRRRQEPPHASGVELAQRDPAPALEVAQQQAGDQVAGDDEEHVDAGEAATEAGHAEVVADDGTDGDRAEPLDVGAMPARRRRDALWVAGHRLHGGGR